MSRSIRGIFEIAARQPALSNLEQPIPSHASQPRRQCVIVVVTHWRLGHGFRRRFGHGSLQVGGDAVPTALVAATIRQTRADALPLWRVRDGADPLGGGLLFNGVSGVTRRLGRRGGCRDGYDTERHDREEQSLTVG
jgi:hypothetical protein